MQLMYRLRDLGLEQRLFLELSTEVSNAGQSWEELKAAKVASDEKAAAAKVGRILIWVLIFQR